MSFLAIAGDAMELESSAERYFVVGAVGKSLPFELVGARCGFSACGRCCCCHACGGSAASASSLAAEPLPPPEAAAGGGAMAGCGSAVLGTSSISAVE